MSRILHWLMGFLILCMFVLGWEPKYIPLISRSAAFQAHILIGFSILYLVFLRLLVRLFYPAPLLKGQSLYKAAVKGAHICLYVAMIFMPLSGWLCLNARGAKVDVFGLFGVPYLIAKDRSMAGLLADFHGTLALLFIGLIAAHVAGALYHGFIKRDDTLQKMTF